MTPTPGSSGPVLAISRLQRVGWLLLFLVTAVIAAQYIWQFSVSRDIAWDEGYLMISMRGFLDGHALYDDVFTQYGPAYYLLRAPLFSWLDIPLDHSWTRLLSMAAWVASALLIAAAVWRATGSLLWCWLALLQSVVHLTGLGNEPGHPQELVALLLAMIVFVLAGPSASPRGWYLIAALVALLGMIKVNVGVFALLGLGLLHLSTLRRLPLGVLPMLALASGCLPALLMWRHLGEAWALTYAATASAAIVASSLCLLQQQRQRAQAVAAIPLPGFFLVLIAVAGVCVIATLLHGTTWHGLIDGLLRAPLRFADVYVDPLDALPWARLNAAAAVLTAVFCCWQAGRGRAPQWIGVFKLVFGAAGAVLLAASYERQLLLLAPWLWLVLVPPYGRHDRDAARSSEILRYGTAALAAFQLLQAYPVAGSQVAWSTLLLIVAYTLCLHDAAQLYRQRRQHKTAATGAPGAVARAGMAATAGAACVLVLAVYTVLWMELPRLRAHHAATAPLALPGTHLVRLNPSLNALYRTLTEHLKADADTFVTYPGFHSLYFWTGMAPPTHYNTTVWQLLSDDQQAAIVAALRRHARPRIMLSHDPREYWRSRDPATLRPFERLVVEEYEDVAIIGPIVILAPRSAASPAVPATGTAEPAAPAR